MATYTSYLQLKKPEGGERYALADFNANMQKIDDFAGTTKEVYITNEYSTILSAINAFRETKTFPFTIQKAGSSAISDLPSGLSSTCEWNVVCSGNSQRITAILTVFTGGSSSNGWSWTANIYNGSYILGWTSLRSQLIRLDPYEPAWTANANLNDYTQTGIYYLSTSRQNGVGGDWGMLQIIGGRADTFNQIYRANGRIFEREYRASQGWTEWKELTNRNAPISYYSLIDRVALSKVATDYTFYNNRSLATYPTISIQPIIGGYFRQGLVIPRNHFNSASNGKFSLTYPSGGENVEIVLNYIDDTKIKMKYNATGTFNVEMIIDGLVNG